MKTRFLLSLACAAGLVAATPTLVHARGNDAVRNAVLGGIAGAIIGEHNDHRAAEGAAIGAAAGLLLTALTDDHGHHGGAPHYRETVIVSRPHCPPTRRVVVAPPCPPHRVVVVAPRHDDRYHHAHGSWSHHDGRRTHHHDYRGTRDNDRRSRRAHTWDRR